MGGTYSMHGIMIMNVYKILVGKTEGKRPLGRTRFRWEDNIRMELKEKKSCHSSVGIELGYGMDDRGSSFRFPAGVGLKNASKSYTKFVRDCVRESTFTDTIC
jgi:hypothetical protein